MASLIQRYVKPAAKKVKAAVVEVASDVLSAPKRGVYNLRTRYENEKYGMLKAQSKKLQSLKAMDAAKVPDAGNESDELFRYRVNLRNK